MKAAAFVSPPEPLRLPPAWWALGWAACLVFGVGCAEHAGPALEDDDASLAQDAAPSADVDSAPSADGGDAGVDSGAPDAAMQAADAGSALTRPRRSLVAPVAWVEQPPATDPFSDRPANSACAATGYMAELLNDEGAFSVDTGMCSYVTVKQFARDDVAAGETLKVRLWHFELSAPEPARAHAAVLVDGVTVLDEHIDIPSSAMLLTRQLRVERAIAAGAPIYFHLHNHGANSWSLVELSTGP